MVSPHTDVMTCFPHSSTPKRPSVCAFHEATERSDRVEVITTKPETSPEYMRSLSPEMKSALTAELCERMMCSGDGAEAGADIWLEQVRRTFGNLLCSLASAGSARGKSDRNNLRKRAHTEIPRKNMLLHYICMHEYSQASVFKKRCTCMTGQLVRKTTG